MSSTIGFGLSMQASNDELKKQILEIAKSHGYLVSYDLSIVESEVFEGIAALASALELKLLFLLHAPPRPDVALAFAVIEEMRNLDYQTTPLKFFRFLEELSNSLKVWVTEFTVFFASEWNTDLRVRKMEGSLDDLINTLKDSGGWYLILFDPKRNAWQESDEHPLVFTVKL